MLILSPISLFQHILPVKCSSLMHSFIRLTRRKGKWKCYLLSPVLLFATPWTVALQAPLSRGISRQEYESGLPFPPSGDLHTPGMEPTSPASLLNCRKILYHWATGEGWWKKHRKAPISNLHSVLKTLHGLTVFKFSMIQGFSKYVGMNIV